MHKKFFLALMVLLSSVQYILAIVNLNTATVKELETLSGIGEAKAKAVIAYRKQHGNFTQVAQIMKVPGIGHKIYLQNLHQLSVTIPTDILKPKQSTPPKKYKKIKYIYPAKQR